MFGMLLILLLVANEVFSTADLLPYGVEFDDELLPPMLNGSSPPLTFPNLTVPFLGEKETTLYVSSYGVLSLRHSIAECGSFANHYILIIPFWYCRHDNPSQISYRFSEDINLLSEVGSNISDAFKVNFRPVVLFITTWNIVLLHIGNTYQAIIATDGNATYVLFLYERIQWAEGINGNVGFCTDGRCHILPESFTKELALKLEITSNVEIPGAYYFRVDQDSVILPPVTGEGVTLQATTSGENLFELDSGMSTNVTLCFTAMINESLNSIAVFHISLHPLSTATLQIDFNFTSSYLIIPAGTKGQYLTCFNVTIIGDSQIESNETVILKIVPLSELATVSFPHNANAITIDIFNDDDFEVLLPFGEDFGDKLVPPGLHSSSPMLTFPSTTIPFLGGRQSTIYVHSYGQLSFQNNAGECSRNPIYDTLIVPFWQCHQDNRNSNSQILYRFSEDITILNKVGTIISDAYQVSFSPAVLFIATWNKVPHYGGPNTVGNTYQAVIATDGNVAYVLFIYQDIQWGDNRTIIGFYYGDRRYYLLPETFSYLSILNLEDTSNIGIPGVYCFKVDRNSVVLPPQDTSAVTSTVLIPVATLSFGAVFGIITVAVITVIVFLVLSAIFTIFRLRRAKSLNTCNEASSSTDYEELNIYDSIDYSQLDDPSVTGVRFVNASFTNTTEVCTSQSLEEVSSSSDIPNLTSIDQSTADTPETVLTTACPEYLTIVSSDLNSESTVSKSTNETCAIRDPHATSTTRTGASPEPMLAVMDNDSCGSAMAIITDCNEAYDLAIARPEVHSYLNVKPEASMLMYDPETSGIGISKDHYPETSSSEKCGITMSKDQSFSSNNLVLNTVAEITSDLCPESAIATFHNEAYGVTEDDDHPNAN